MDADDCKESASALGKILDEALTRDARREDDARRRARIEEICAKAVRHHVNAALGEDDHQKPVKRSLYGYLLTEMAKAASSYALAVRLEPDDFELNGLERALQIVVGLRSAMIHDWSDKTLDFFDPNASPLDKIKAEKVPDFDRSSIEGVVGDYLALPYRWQALDRFFVRILIAIELYAFGQEMFNEKTFDWLPPRSPLKQRHALVSYLRGQVLNALLFGGIAAAAIWANSLGWLSETATGWITGGCVSLFVLGAAIATISLPFEWRKQRKARHQVLELFSMMNTLYNELKSDGPISGPYIRERAVETSNKGVVWPAPLFAILDDIIARTGRF